MDESSRQLSDRMRDAVAKGGPGAAFAFLQEMGVVVEKEPEVGVNMRMRFGAGPDDRIISTSYAASAERPTGWPPEVPFLPDLVGSLTLFEQPGRGFSVQWFKVADPSAAVQRILDECVADGWRVLDAAEPDAPSLPPGMKTVQLTRDDVKRVLSSVTVREFSIVQLLERGPGQSCEFPAMPAPGQ